MSALPMAAPPRALTTDGTIAVINLRSALDRAWGLFWQAPLRPGIAEQVLEQEQLCAQFIGDLVAFDRAEKLERHLTRIDPASARTAMVQAQVAASTHRFADARRSLARAAALGAPSEDMQRLVLSVDQACGTALDAVREARQRRARDEDTLEAWLPLGALLADLREFDQADRAYRCALAAYRDVSPFAVAWGCFQLGVLWGEQALEPEPRRAMKWYQRAIDHLPGYVKARVHLAELHLSAGPLDKARHVLLPALGSGDPEVEWRYADILFGLGQLDEANRRLALARNGFEALLASHPLAFADHAAAFFGGSGNDAGRAFALAKLDLANRPTLQAFERAHAAAIGAGQAQEAHAILAAACDRWASAPAFRCSPLRVQGSRKDEGAHAD